MNEKWTQLGKASSILGENAGFLVLIALCGNKIPPEYLITVHALIMAAKGVYLRFCNHAAVHETLEKIAKLVITKSVEITKEHANTTANKIMQQVRDDGMKISVTKMSNIIFKEMSK
jgi:hypothetical protein